MADTAQDPDETAVESWHRGKAGGALVTAILGVILIATDNAGLVPPIVLGIAMIVVALAGTVVTGFWSSYRGLVGWRKAVAWLASVPGAVWFFILIWMMKTIYDIAAWYRRTH
jgi:hypothetical protein